MCENKIKKSKIEKAKEDLKQSIERLKKSIHEGENTFCELINTLWQHVEVEKENRS